MLGLICAYIIAKIRDFSKLLDFLCNLMYNVNNLTVPERRANSMQVAVISNGLYYDDLSIGHSMISPSRVVTSQDIFQFALLTGDTNPIHLDDEAAVQASFKRRIAHGALVLSIATGLAYQMGLVKGSVIFSEIRQSFKRPVYPEDQISIRLTVIDRQEVARPANSGRVTLRAEILNQSGKTVQEGDWTAFVSKR
jgi:acyl dehydratase